MNLQDILKALGGGCGPSLLGTVVGKGGALGARGLGPRLAAEDAQAAEEVLLTGRSRLVQGEALLLLERLVPGKLPPWLHFCVQVLDRGKSCVLVTVCRVEGEIPYGLGDHFAYDERNHGLLPMDGAVSLEVQRACQGAREGGGPVQVTLPVPGGVLDLLLEPLKPLNPLESLEPLEPAGVPVVILAAGASRRLGRPKQLVELEGETLLRRIARAALATGGPVTVVTGCRAPEMAANLEGLAVRVVVNPEWEEGMAASIRAGVRSLPAGSAGVLLLLCDQPGVDAGLLARLQAAHRADPLAVVACGYGGTRGTPALFPAKAFPGLLELRGDQGARGLLRGGEVVVVPFPEGEKDVDRPGDLG